MVIPLLFSKDVNEIIGSRMGTTFFIAFLAFVVCWSFAIPVGILVAVKQYTFIDYFFTFLGFIGLAVPGFLVSPGIDVYILLRALA